MKTYIKESIDRFKVDALAKVIYDLFKWIIPAGLLFAATNWIPPFTKWLSTSFAISIYWFVLYSLGLVILTVIAFNIIFRRKYKELQTDNFTDELTGLKNHKALKNYLTERLKELHTNSKTMSVIIIDIDDFKNFNTNVGFNKADEILRKVGELLGNDKRVTDETFRQFLRGDEFFIVTNETSLNDALRAAERKRTLIQNTSFSIGGASYTLTVSCGITEYKRGGDDFVSLTDRAILALNEAKKQVGKNCSRSII